YSDSLDYWRKFFRCCMTNIFDVIRNAFLVASTDNPDEFLNHRDEMVEMIHTWSQCYSGRALEAERVDPDRLGEDDGGSRRRPQEEIKIVGSVDEPGTSKQHEKGKRKVRLYDDDEDEEPSDEPEKEERGIGEDMRIKELVMKHKGEEADAILLELLRQLRTLKMSVNTIQMIVEEEIRGTAPTAPKRQRRIQIMEPHELPEPLPHGIEGPETGKRHYRGRSGRWYRWH
ncbi:hypothetical protein BHE74_00053824, partial [Ensete ventricosum]